MRYMVGTCFVHSGGLPVACDGPRSMTPPPPPPPPPPSRVEVGVGEVGVGGGVGGRRRS